MNTYRKIVCTSLITAVTAFGIAGCESTQDGREAPPPNTRTPSTLPSEDPRLPENNPTMPPSGVDSPAGP